MNIIKNKENDQDETEKSDEQVKSSEVGGISRGSSKYDHGETVKSGEKVKYYEAIRILAASNKLAKPANFFKISSTNELIEECKKQTGLEIVHYELKKGVPTKYAGMYVHKLIYEYVF